MMSTDEQLIDEYLRARRKQGQSAPAGRYWDELYRIITADTPKEERPALPLILGGSVASNEDKQSRLREHLLWASARGRLRGARDYLDKVPPDGWNTGDEADWSKSFSWGDD
ncbi:hypothetical protein [Hyphomicrobium sp.]|uniref:hypothetical protein n=1 Tax=Hyphomicrobium sp. TaxID=82 RepID=UPI003F71C4AC